MLRVVELALTFGPLLIFPLLYALVVGRRRPSARVVTLAMLLVTGLGTWLIWTGTSEDLSRNERYVPAKLQDGAVVDGHGTSR